MELIVAISIFGLVFGILYYLLGSRGVVTDDIIQRRLESISTQPKESQRVRLYTNEEITFWEQVANFFLGEKEMPARFSKIGKLLHQASYRGERAIRIFWGVRIFLTLAISFGGLFLSFFTGATMSDTLTMVVGGGLIGYMLPYLSVRRKAKQRVLEMKETLPDTLDLLVVCVEAGMGMDAAMNRVGREQSAQNLVIGDEIMLCCQEMQAGAPRKESLNRLAERMGVEDFRNLITFITQTEEFGGSVARSLRVFASTMRDKRSKAAEEAVRKTVIKLIFPLVFFILPAIFILVLGPPGLKIMQILSNPLG
jgi:tight adherence protein C